CKGKSMYRILVGSNVNSKRNSQRHLCFFFPAIEKY
ncbi:MAG: hypothetical protein ACI8RD_007528, partial [Bacillariaceae sp.]